MPEEVGFAIKSELAVRMLQRAFGAQVPSAWVTGDEIYGNDSDLRGWLEREERPHVLAVSCSHPIWREGRQDRADALAASLPADAWATLSAGVGSQGERLYDWVCIRLPYETAHGMAQWLLVTVPEVRRLLLALTEPDERFCLRLAWSTFRRRHQSIAQRCHAVRRAHKHPVSTSVPVIQVLSCSNLKLTDEQWTRISPLLPAQKPRTGRPNSDHRTIVAGILWVAHTGASWRELPDRFGPWQTIYSRYHRWRKAGIWQQVLEILSSGPVANAP